MVLRMRQTGGVHEVAVGHAQAGGGGVHQVGEGVLAAGDVLGHRDAGVVAGLDDDAVQQVAQGHLGADLDEHPRAAGAPGVLADGDQVLLADLALADLQGGDVGGHQLGQAGRRQALVAALLDQHAAAVGIHQQPGLGGQLRRCRDDLLGRPGAGHCGEQD
ncbi:hypothetical protein D3C75_844610 [compost metagenome]